MHQADGKVLGRNTYWHNRKNYQDYRALSAMEKASVSLTTLSSERVEGDETIWTLQVHNGDIPALSVRLRLIGENGRAILPIFYSDNYLMLMPGESRIITASVRTGDIHEMPSFELTGWNL